MSVNSVEKKWDNCQKVIYFFPLQVRLFVVLQVVQVYDVLKLLVLAQMSYTTVETRTWYLYTYKIIYRQRRMFWTTM